MRIVAAGGLCLALVSLFVAAPAQAFVNIAIDLTTQRMSVTTTSGASFDWPVSTGRPGHLTPRGVFHPQRLMKIAYSIKYEMAPMPHSIFFTGGYAIHGTNVVGLLGRPASHGCVRLSPGNAATLYTMVQREGARISIFGEEPGEAPQIASPRRSHRLARRYRRKSEDTEFILDPGAYVSPDYGSYGYPVYPGNE